MDGGDESGAVEGAESGASSSVNGDTTVDSALGFEVDLLTISALRRIAADIAEQVSAHGAARNGAPVVLVTEDELLAAISYWRYAETGLAAVERAAAGLLEDLTRPVGKTPKKAPHETLGLVVETAAAGLESVAKVLAWLRVDTSYSGRTPEVAPALRPALIGQLATRKIDIVASAAFPDPRVRNDHRSLLARLGRLLEQKGRLEALRKPADPADAAPAKPADPAQARIEAMLGEISGWFAATFEGGEGRPTLARVLAASEIVTLAETSPNALILEVRVIKAGGHYRTRKHLFSTLFGLGALSYSGGAAVAFTLIEAASGKTLLSDVLYHSSGDVRFVAPTDDLITPSNLRAAARNTTDDRPKGKTANTATQEAIVTNPAVSEPVSPNGGDDEAAETGTDRTVPETGPFEASMPWRIAESLLTLRKQINALAPNRDKASDGAIGDAEHRSRNSDHNPWVEEGNMGVVTAMDITHSPDKGCDAEAIAKSIAASGDSRIKYIIWNRQIASSSVVNGVAAWTWRKYTGSNAHTHHIHLSVKPEKAKYDSTAAWTVKTKA